MRMGVYSIYDSTTEVFTKPMFLVNDETAIRGFINAIRNPQTDMYTNPAEFTLFRVETWDDEHGGFIEGEVKRQLGNGLTLLSQIPDQMKKAAELQKQIDVLTEERNNA